jgi:hypothetical protein
MVKGGKNTGIIMIYRGCTTEIPLPNLGLGLYATNSLIMLPSSAAVGRNVSTRIDRGPPTRYYGTDTAPQGPSYTVYQTFDHTGSSQGFQVVHSPWEQATPQCSNDSWQQGASAQWQQGYFNHCRQGSGRHSVDT